MAKVPVVGPVCFLFFFLQQLTLVWNFTYPAGSKGKQGLGLLVSHYHSRIVGELYAGSTAKTSFPRSLLDLNDQDQTQHNEHSYSCKIVKIKGSSQQLPQVQGDNFFLANSNLNCFLLRRKLSAEVNKDVQELSSFHQLFKTEAQWQDQEDSSERFDHFFHQIYEGTPLRPGKDLIMDIKNIVSWFQNDVVLSYMKEETSEQSMPEAKISIAARLVLSDKTPCPRLHVDKVPLRLICTYQGPGTEVVDNKNVQWSNLKKFGGVVQDHLQFNALVAKKQDYVSCREGDIILLKGTVGSTAVVGTENDIISPDNLGVFLKRGEEFKKIALAENLIQSWQWISRTQQSPTKNGIRQQQQASTKKGHLPALHKSPTVRQGQRRLVLILTATYNDDDEAGAEEEANKPLS
mmetsp:Transcript_14337/g.25377  ORF Transcript_14337/g.25377 Transcript_14337/m.25377 type:complete len:405 (-) Transcript_14337:121-1335(-)